MEETIWFNLWNLFHYVLLFFLGASLASFYTTLADRILFYFYEKGRKKNSGWKRWEIMFRKPSHCPSCESKIPKLYLLPILGWIFTKGKCQQCQIPVSKLYPLSELLFGLIAILVFFISESVLGTILLLFFFGHLLIAMITDTKKLSLDYENLPFLLVFGFASNFVLFEETIGFAHLYIYVGFFLFYLLIYLLYRGGTGLGDVIFSPFFASIAGNPFWIVYLNYSYLLALGFSFFLRKKGESLKGKKIPMGLYFSIAMILTFILKLIVHYYEWEGFLPYGNIE
ncbi:peptidase A24, N-terminal domain protein [Leptospira yanagawae serovar Saopaulo str. Sao Paulo = ATCC 700523]|uniref:Prepilin peptidase n=2 Tax=Leptospira yanagawae TaxID=293069 RepID=A0ABY2LZ87_9LEPT|nr:A24 family peptidase [Leptospira yanagawae]EOQ90475.1 peptidase A24, N-terminal domain protein [Leptospira yanagawae serovar Saopaulo str. Sao Paulo = ATCC 700523]TGL19071.1 prepilin peptidase [Leptospira yanagawae]